MRILFFILLSVLISSTAYSQTKNCNCKSNFEWMKKTFEENDAGFQYIIDKKGQAAYDIHNQLISKKIKSAKTLFDCSDIMNEWLKFFRSGHIGIVSLNIKTPNSQPTSKKAENKTWNVDIKQFEKYISEKTEVDFEGIWTFGSETKKVGIKKEGEDFVAFSMDSTKEAVKIILKITKEGESLNTIYFAKGISPYKIPNPQLIGNKYIKFGEWGTWKRLSPKFTDKNQSFTDEIYYKSINSKKPYLEELNPNTLCFRIPSFNIKHKAAIDSVITVNKDKILKTKNLIIDIRNGTGGTNNSYQSLLPFLYTNPVRIPGMEFLSTKLNNRNLKDVMSSPQFKSFDEKAQQDISEMYEKLQSRLGEFVLIDKEINIQTQDTIYEYPKNIGIIINHQNVSADEGFLLEAKQSKKVKLFGTTTFGAFDISNVLSVVSPCKEYQLIYCISRSVAIPDMTIDEVGIQPDYYIDKSIPDNKWVEFVNDILNK